MGKDVTQVFRSTVQALRMALEGEEEQTIRPRPAGQPSQSTDEFQTIAARLNQSLTDMGHLLRAKQAEYLKIRSSESSLSDGSSVDMVSALDAQVEQLLHVSTATMRQLRDDVERPKGTPLKPQLQGHRRAVLAILQEGIDRLYTQYKQQVDVRRKRAALCKRITNTTKIKTSRSKTRPSAETEEEKANEERPSADTETSEGLRNRSEPTPLVVSSLPVPNPPVDMERLNLTPEELQQLQEENEVFLEEMTHMNVEMRSLESRIMQLDQLQRVFGEHVQQQEQEIDVIVTKAVESTENIRTGNEQLREAMQNKSTMRFWILFTVILLTFSLHFLHWYND